MPSLEDSLISKVNMSNYSPIDKPSAVIAQFSTPEYIKRDIRLRCPVPPQSPVSPDNLRAFYLNSSVPQTRVYI